MKSSAGKENTSGGRLQQYESHSKISQSNTEVTWGVIPLFAFWLESNNGFTFWVDTLEWFCPTSRSAKKRCSCFIAKVEITVLAGFTLSYLIWAVRIWFRVQISFKGQLRNRIGDFLCWGCTGKEHLYSVDEILRYLTRGSVRHNQGENDLSMKYELITV